MSARRWQHDPVVKLPRCVPCLLPLIEAAGTRGLDECKKLELMIADEKKKFATTNARDAAFMVDVTATRERASGDKTHEKKKKNEGGAVSDEQRTPRLVWYTLRGPRFFFFASLLLLYFLHLSEVSSKDG